MTREEAIRILEETYSHWLRLKRESLLPNDECVNVAEAIDMAIEALNIEQQIIENGYTGKEMRIRIGGRLFAVRELAQ